MYPTKPLWKICEFQNWFAFKSNLFKDTWKPILRISNIQDNNMSYNRLVYFDLNDYNVDLSKYIVSKWDLVIAMSWATTWKLAINNTDDDFYLNQRVWKFIFDNDITKKYTHFLLSTKIQENLNQSVWSAIPNLSTEQIKNIQIPLPSLPTQKLIVQKLDLSFENINKQIDLIKKNLSSLEELNKSVLEKVFSEWELVTFDEICNKVTDWSHNPPKWVEYWIPMISSRNLDDNNNVTFDNIRYIDNENYIRENKRTNVEEWDILLSIVWTIWKVAIVKSEYWKFVMQRSLAVLKLKRNMIEPFYIYYFLKSNISQKVLIDWANWAAQQWIYLKEIKKLTIPLPPLQKQKEIVTYLDQVFEKNKELKTKYDEQLKELEELKQSLLKDAFEGRLIP